jgi:O-antigen ligase
VLAVVAAITAAVVGLLERRVTVPRAVRQGFAIALVALIVAAIAGVWATHGSPVKLAREGWTAFNSAPKGGDTGDVGSRLLSLSSNNRTQQWHVSIRTFRDSPLLGHGGGTFSIDWARYRPSELATDQPHSLYLGVLGELGAMGLVLIVSLALLPFVGAYRARGLGLVPPLFGAYVAWAVHASVDWDWALTGVTLPALLLGLAISQAGSGTRVRAEGAQRLGVAAVMIVAAAIAVPSLIADTKLRQGDDNTYTRPGQALRDADVAARFAPWSSEPDRLRGRVFVAAHRKRDAREALRSATSKDPDRWALWKTLADVTSGAERAHALARERELNPLEAQPG